MDNRQQELLFRAVIAAEEIVFLRTVAHRHHHFIEHHHRPLDHIQMAIGDRIERTGKNRNFFLHDDHCFIEPKDNTFRIVN